MRTDVPLDIEAVFQPRVPTVVENFMEDESMGNEGVMVEVSSIEEAVRLAGAETPDEPTQEVAKAYVYPTGARDAAKDIALGTSPPGDPQPAPAVAVVEQPGAG